MIEQTRTNTYLKRKAIPKISNKASKFLNLWTLTNFGLSLFVGENDGCSHNKPNSGSNDSVAIKLGFKNRYISLKLLSISQKNPA